MKTKKEIKDAYKSMEFRAGIFQIINKKDDRIFLKASQDLDKAFNSDLFQLKAGMHCNQQLQQDWNSLGAENFEFRVLDELKPKNDASPNDIRNELKEFLKMYENELKTDGQLLY